MTSQHPRPVLVAVADEHDAALRFAATEAVRGGRPLLVVHVVRPPRGLTGPESLLITFDAVELVAEQLLRRQYERALDLVDGAVTVRKALRHGAVVDNLLELSHDAEQVVLQHRQQGRLRRLLTGSTAAGMAARCPVPVVSVPELWPGPRLTPQVCVGLPADASSADDCLLDRAFHEAVARGASLTVVHAISLPTDYGGLTVSRPTLDAWQRLARGWVEERLAPWCQTHPTVDVRVETPHARAVDALVHGSGDSDLLLVGRRRPHGQVHLGSITRTLVRETLCPLVVVGEPVPATTTPSATHAATAR